MHSTHHPGIGHVYDAVKSIVHTALVLIGLIALLVLMSPIFVLLTCSAVRIQVPDQFGSEYMISLQTNKGSVMTLVVTRETDATSGGNTTPSF